MKKVFTVLLMTALMVFAVLPVFAQGGNESAAAEKAVFPTGDSLTIIVPVSDGAGMDTQEVTLVPYFTQSVFKGEEYAGYYDNVRLIKQKVSAFLW